MSEGSHSEGAANKRSLLAKQFAETCRKETDPFEPSQGPNYARSWLRVEVLTSVEKCQEVPRGSAKRYGAGSSPAGSLTQPLDARPHSVTTMCAQKDLRKNRPNKRT
jgi:hypothetical protein